MKTRPYQDEAIQALYMYFASHREPEKNPVIALPTGTGKSIVIAAFIKGIMQAWPNQRILMLTHVKELIDQNADKMLMFWPQAPLGIYSAGLKSKQASMPITFAGIQSARNHPDRFGHIDLIIIDECHLVSPDTNASYHKIIAFLRQKNPFLRIIGLSATPYRLGLGMITDGGIFTDVCYDATSRKAFTRLIDDGYLCPLIPMQTKTVIDVSDVAKRGGEFIEADLQNVVVREQLTRAALNEAVESASTTRKHWLIFATGIKHVHMIHDILTEMNIDSTYIHSQLDDNVRDENLRRFKAGEAQVMINANILTTGFDYPELDCIILLRPTSSPVLHVQVLGRGTRPAYVDGFDLDATEGRLAAIEASDKRNCLVLDFAGNVRRLGPVNDPRIPKKGSGEGTGDIPVKTCPLCNCINHISARVCDNCGAEFKFIEKIEAKASTLDLIVRDEPQVEWFDVDRITYSVHHKIGKPDSLRVSYYCGLQRFQEWICLEHEGAVRNKAHRWWTQRSGRRAPDTVEEAREYADHLHQPKRIRVWVNKRFPDILSYDFGYDADRRTA